jgi:uncharacterized membrane protein YpjA
VTFLRRALLFGLFIWLLPFAVAFIIFPLRESARPLFESVMPVAISVVTVVLGIRYLRTVNRNLVREGVLLGLMWLAICIIIDAPLMLLGGPMKMTVAEYAADIGVTYLMIPVITIGLAVASAVSDPQRR